MKRVALFFALLAPSAAFAGGHPVDPITAASAMACVEHPVACEAVSSMRFAPSRNGALRLIGAQADSRTAAVHLNLAVHGALPDEQAAAHAQLAGASLQDPTLFSVALAMGSPAVRAGLLSGLGRSTSSVSGDALVLGLSDADGHVREVAASVLSRRADASKYGPALAVAAADPVAAVRLLAVRALGWHGVSSAVSAVEARVTDSDPLVRRAALQSLARLDQGRAAIAARTLTADVDGRVRIAAGQVLAE